MKLTISSSNEGVFSVDIPSSLTFEDFKAYVLAETGIDSTKQVLKLNGKRLEGNSKTLQELGVNDNDLLELNSESPESSAPSNRLDYSNEADHQSEMIRQQILSNPQMRNQLAATNPEVISVLDNPQRFKEKLLEQFMQYGGANGSQEEELRRLEADPDSAESQERILEIIRQRQIDGNMQLAMDIMPESFVPVSMLYVQIKVNGHNVQAFVDTGAQTTIISTRLAEEVGIAKLIDKRFQGEARGVGTGKIRGKIHSVPINFGDSTIDLPCSLVVLDAGVDFLLGLDILRRYKCQIDLGRDCLVVGGNIEAKFLHDSEVKNPFGAQAASSSAGLGQSLGGNIFSDPAPSVPNSKLKPASSASAEAAIKRQSSSESNSNATSYTPVENDIKKLLDLGFSRMEAIKALKLTNGNLELAASFLFQ